LGNRLQRVAGLLLAGTLGAGVALADAPAGVSGPAAAPAAVSVPSAAASTPATAAPAPRPLLDLKAPGVEHVMPHADIQSMVEERELPLGEDVEVQQPRYGVPVPVGFLRALPWAVMHPTQAWRIFTPVVEP